MFSFFSIETTTERFVWIYTSMVVSTWWQNILILQQQQQQKTWFYRRLCVSLSSILHLNSWPHLVIPNQLNSIASLQDIFQWNKFSDETSKCKKNNERKEEKKIFFKLGVNPSHTLIMSAQCNFYPFTSRLMIVIKLKRRERK